MIHGIHLPIHWKLNYRKQKQVEGVSAPKMKIVDIANSVDPDGVAQKELPRLDLHCLPSFFELSV